MGKVIVWIVGSVCLVAGFAAGYLILNHASHSQPVSTPILSSPSSGASPSPSASGNPTTSPSARPFSEGQNLSQPNLIEAIPNGGSLITIAQTHGVSVTTLAQLNAIPDPNKVYAGQSVIVPDTVSDDTLILLYVTNPLRLTKEKNLLQSGATSIYADPITAAQADMRLYDFKADTPYSKSNETATSVTLSTTNDTKLVSLNLEKNEAGLWLIKKATIKLIAKTSPSPTP